MPVLGLGLVLVLILVFILVLALVVALVLNPNPGPWPSPSPSLLLILVLVLVASSSLDSGEYSVLSPSPILIPDPSYKLNSPTWLQGGLKLGADLDGRHQVLQASH